MRLLACNCFCVRPALSMAAVFVLTCAHIAVALYMALSSLATRHLLPLETLIVAHAFFHWFVFIGICIAAHRGAATEARWLCVVFRASTSALFVQYACTDSTEIAAVGAARLALLFTAHIIGAGLEANVWRMRPPSSQYVALADGDTLLSGDVQREFASASADMGVPLRAPVTETSESIDSVETESQMDDVLLLSDEPVALRSPPPTPVGSKRASKAARAAKNKRA